MSAFAFHRLDGYGRVNEDAVTSEADLRDALGALAWCAGWQVAMEVAMSNGGRADLVVWDGAVVVPIELKLELRTTRQYRLGFQQADGYRRHYATSPRVQAVLSGLRVSDWAGNGLSASYPEVQLLHAEDLALFLTSPGPFFLGGNLAARQQQAQRRLDATNHQAKVIQWIRSQQDEMAAVGAETPA